MRRSKTQNYGEKQNIEDQKLCNELIMGKLGKYLDGVCKYIYFCMPRGFVSMAKFVQFVRFEHK